MNLVAGESHDPARALQQVQPFFDGIRIEAKSLSEDSGVELRPEDSRGGHQLVIFVREVANLLAHHAPDRFGKIAFDLIKTTRHRPESVASSEHAAFAEQPYEVDHEERVPLRSG